MKMKKVKLTKQTKIILAVIALLLVGLITYKGVQYYKLQQEISRGRAYLKQLDDQSLSNIKNTIDKQNESDELALGKQALKDYEKNKDKLWGAFKNYVLIGDSRVETFKQFLPETNVLAKKGTRITKVDDYLGTIKNISPKYVFISYGVNDLSIPAYYNQDKYIEVYQSYCEKIKKVAPDATIYVNSIIPVNDKAINKQANYKNIPSYNAKLKAMCKKNGYKYVDLDALAKQHPDEYEQDGIHFKSSFYKYWAYRLLSSVYGG